MKRAIIHRVTLTAALTTALAGFIGMLLNSERRQKNAQRGNQSLEKQTEVWDGEGGNVSNTPPPPGLSIS